jgi:hypothetical protein
MYTTIRLFKLTVLCSLFVLVIEASPAPTLTANIEEPVKNVKPSLNPQTHIWPTDGRPLNVQYPTAGPYALPKPVHTSSPKSVKVDPRKIIAIGDLNSDLKQTIKVFRMAGIINDHNDWVSKNTIVVQIVSA